jgi:sigma-B regulation protein RsbU (phosphoserine phosphatase)
MAKFELVYDGQVRVLDLEDGDHTVGRSSGNSIQIPVSSVSKRHAMLRVDGTSLFVRDLGSTNGTEIDGKPVGSEETEVVGQATVRFAGVPLHRPRENTAFLPELSTNEELSSEVSYRPTEGYSEAARTRIVEMLSGLFELIASGAKAGEVEDRACEFVSRLVPADRVVLLEDDGEGTRLRAKARWTRGSDPGDRLRLSSSIVGQVLQNRESVLVANALNDPKFSGSESIVALDLRSAMAAPLFDNQRVRGILYLDTADPRVMYSPEDLQVITATANAVAVKLRNLTLEGELKTAARIQKAMLPDTIEPPPGYEIHAHLVMCRAVGGDLYHCLKRPDGRTLISLGDVAGKGMPAALAMSACVVLVRTLAEIQGNVLHIVDHLHRQLFLSLAPEQFVTLFLAELDPPTGTLEYVNAGHNPPLLLRKDGTMQELAATGMPVAMIEHVPIQKGSVRMEPGDLLTIFSDGIPEATRDGETMHEVAPMVEILEKNADRPLAEISAKIVQSVDDFLGGMPTSDDVTLLIDGLDRRPTQQAIREVAPRGNAGHHLLEKQRDEDVDPRQDPQEHLDPPAQLDRDCDLGAVGEEEAQSTVDDHRGGQRQPEDPQSGDLRAAVLVGGWIVHGGPAQSQMPRTALASSLQCSFGSHCGCQTSSTSTCCTPGICPAIMRTPAMISGPAGHICEVRVIWILSWWLRGSKAWP